MTTDDKEKCTSLKYTSAQRRHECKSGYIRKKIRWKKTIRIQELEDKLSKTNSRTSSEDKFKEYIKTRFQVQEELYKHYEEQIYRIYRFKAYQNKQKSEWKLIENIREKFGPNPILAYGSWNNPYQLKGCNPAPTCGIRRKLSHHFEVINVPEAYTTKT